MPPTDSKSKAPNFYESAAMSGGAPGGAPGGGPKGPDSSSGEKVQNVKTLLEVVQKLDSMEQDPALKALTQQIVSATQQYMDKVQGGGKQPDGGAPPMAPMGGGAAPGAAPAGGAGMSPVPA